MVIDYDAWKTGYYTTLSEDIYTEEEVQKRLKTLENDFIADELANDLYGRD